MDKADAKVGKHENRESVQRRSNNQVFILPLQAVPCSCEVPEKKSVSFLIAGRARAGKTALANSIAGEKVGREGNESTELVLYTAGRKGVDINIWDTPGLQGNDSCGFLNDLKEIEGQYDIVVYCVQMHDAKLEKLDIENLSLITRVMGVEFWSQTIIALTFANCVFFKCPPSHRENDSCTEIWFQQQHKKWEKQL